MYQMYSIKVTGISCTNCGDKIQKALREHLEQKLKVLSVNILQQKINIGLASEQSLQSTVELLQRIGYPVVSGPMLIQSSDRHIRTLTFVYEINAKSEQLEKRIKQLPGVTSLSRFHVNSNIKLSVSYNCQTIKGRQIANIVNEADDHYKVINHLVQSFKTHKVSKSNGPNIKVTAFLCIFFFLVNMILPITGEWYQAFMVFPTRFGIFTFSVLLNFILTIYVLNVYAKPLVRRAYQSYVDYGDMNMQTLVSLGSLSAFSLFIFFLIRFTLDYLNNSLQPVSAIMRINEALTSSSIILLVVTIGKHLEAKVKEKIVNITNEIFPDSTLFNDMLVNYVQLKNRKLMVKNEKVYDVTLIEEGDILRPKSGILLVDCIVISGQVHAIQSTMNGNDEIAIISQGARIESGARIKSFDPDTLLQVENVFESSLLLEVGTHIKLRQNEQSSAQSSIQVACKKISKYFVKTVILLSISVMVSWFFLLSFKYVTIPTCNICWIVERGIGVLVASCPCALGLAVPSVVAIVLNIAIKNGIIIRNNAIIEKMKFSKIIAFDKTGTLFTRINKIQEFYALNSSMEINHLWQILSIMEKEIKHPLAQLIYKEAFNRSQVNGTNFNFLLVDKVITQQNGLSSRVVDKQTKEQYEVLVGNQKLMEAHSIHVPKYGKTTQGSTQILLALNGKCYLVMILNTHSNLRPQAQHALSILMKEGKQVHILSGDSADSVKKLGNLLSIPQQQLHPQHSAFMKMQWIKETQKQIEKNKSGVVMVGDGLNDIPCLQEAAIGVSINAKSQLNLHAADVIMLTQDLYKIATLVQLIKRGNQFININLFWAFAYNVVMMPIVAGVFYGYGLTMSPVWSSIAMSCSSIIVVVFSHFLSFFKYEYEDNLKTDITLTDSEPSQMQTNEKYMQLSESINE